MAISCDQQNTVLDATKDGSSAVATGQEKTMVSVQCLRQHWKLQIVLCVESSSVTFFTHSLFKNRFKYFPVAQRNVFICLYFYYFIIIFY